MMVDTGLVTSRGHGIHQIRLPMTGNPLRYVNGYLLEEPDGFTLVDCGWKAADVAAALDGGLKSLGRSLKEIRRVAITHQHFDHYGMAGTLHRETQCDLLMHELDWQRDVEIDQLGEELDRA